MRVSFVGGGTDFPEFWAGGRKGHVLSATIDLYCYVQIKDMFDANVRVHHARIETESTASRIKHSYARTALESFGLFRGVEAVITADVMTTGSGLGASSSVMTALICACRELRGEPALSPAPLATEAYRLETEAGTVGGLQDQYAVAFGGLNSITFSRDEVVVDSLHLDSTTEKGLSDRLFLVYSNLTRKHTSIQKHHGQNITEREKLEYLDQILGLSYEFEKELVKPSPDFDLLGAILHESWIRKKEFNHYVTNPYIDELYNQLRESGILGGKILGAGGGGFILALSKEGVKDRILYSLYPNYIAVNFSFSQDGVSVVWKNWQ
jgi:D-glycero-alpha-D-manno-heptose-7-phosphate kinase